MKVVVALYYLVVLLLGWNVGSDLLHQWWAVHHFQTAPALFEEPKISEFKGSKGSSYTVAFSYEYEVNGVRYRGDRYRFGQPARFLLQWKARDLAALYPGGSNHPIWYDPEQPVTAVVKIGFKGSDISRVMMIIAWALFPISIWMTPSKGQSRKPLLQFLNVLGWICFIAGLQAWFDDDVSMSFMTIAACLAPVAALIGALFQWWSNKKLGSLGHEQS